MNGKYLIKITFCFLLLQSIIGAGLLMAGSNDQSMPEALKAETDQELHALWNKMRTALSNNDIETALTCFAEKSQKTYKTLFEKVSHKKLRKLAEALEDLQLIKFHSAGRAEYDVQDVSYGDQISWMVFL
jgi:hypothetical protein